MLLIEIGAAGSCRKYIIARIGGVDRLSGPFSASRGAGLCLLAALLRHYFGEAIAGTMELRTAKSRDIAVVAVGELPL